MSSLLELIGTARISKGEARVLQISGGSPSVRMLVWICSQLAIGGRKREFEGAAALLETLSRVTRGPSVAGVVAFCLMVRCGGL
jgi:hypothetical protein